MGISVDCICVIHIAERVDRYEVLLKEFETQDIDISKVKFMPGVICKNPATGISKAHKECVRFARDSKMSSITILEDDVKFTHPSSWKRYITLAEELPKDWDMYLAGAYGTFGIQPVGESLISVDDTAGLHCYTVNAKFFNKFLDAPETGHLDRWLTKNGKAQTYIAHPFLALQHSGFSDQQKRNVNFEPLEMNFKIWKGTN